MDYLLNPKECESREEYFDPKLMKYNSDFMFDNWSPNSFDLMDSIFDTDLLNFDEIDDLSKQIKFEPAENEINTTVTSNVKFNDVPQCILEPPISSNSSDSGLSSDNLEMDISPEYEPLSPAVSSPGPSISERGEKNSPQRNETASLSSLSSSSSSSSSPYLEHLFTSPSDIHEVNEERIIEKNAIQHHQQQRQQKLQQQQQKLLSSQPAKVIVQKIPQIINLPTKRVFSQSFDNKNIVKEKEIKIVKISPQPFNMSNNINNNKKVTIQMKNSNANGINQKIQSKSGTLLINNKGKITEVKKFIPVQTASNPRSILLPVTVQDMKGLKAYKVFNMSTLKNYNNQHKIFTNVSTVKSVPENSKILKNKIKISDEQCSEHVSDVDSIILEDIKSMDTDRFIEECIDIDETNTDTNNNNNVDNDDDDDDDDDIDDDGTTTDSPYPKLILSAEEKRLLAKEGVTLPSHYPLTKYEERELKRIRRKIRNKISAQDSRKRKKEYVDGLEERVKQCTEENQTLIKKIKLLQTQNQNLMSQMKKLQALLSKGTNKTAHPTTCLMVLLLSLALVATPNLKFGNQNIRENEMNEFVQDAVASDILQNRRSLLFDIKDQQNNDIFDEDMNINDFITSNEFLNNKDMGDGLFNEFSTINNNNNNLCKMNNDSINEPLCKKSKNFIDFDVDDLNWYQTKEMQNIQLKDEQKLQKTVYDLAVETYQKNRSQQTSGFNIKDNNFINSDILDKNIIEKMSKGSTNNLGLYEINIEKFDNAAAAIAADQKPLFHKKLIQK